MRIRWYVDDGYLSAWDAKNRPHYVDVDDGLLDHCDTDEDRENLIEDYVHREFENIVSYYWEKM